MIATIEHERALRSMRMPASVRQVLDVIRVAASFVTGVCGWALSIPRITWITKLPQRTVEWAVWWARDRGVIYVVGKGEHRGNIYGVKLPSQVAPVGALPVGVEPPAPVEPVKPPVESWAGRFAGWVKGVVGVKPEEARDVGGRAGGGLPGGGADVAHSLAAAVSGGCDRPGPRADVGAGGAARGRGVGADVAPVIVPFTGGRGPEPTLMLRPRFDAAPVYRPPPPGVLVPVECGARGRGGAPARLDASLGWLDPGPDPRERDLDDLERFSHGNPVSSRDVGDMTEPPLDLDVEPVDGAFHVGPTFSEAEWRERQAVPDYMRAPLAPSGTGDAAPHRRVELAYRQAYFDARGVQPIVGPRDHAAFASIIRDVGLDGALRLIRETYAHRFWSQHRSIRSIAHLAFAEACKRRGAAREKN